MLRASGSTCEGILAPEGFSVIVPPWFLQTLSLDFKLELLAKDPHSRSLIYSELGRDVGWGLEAVRVQHGRALRQQGLPV